MVSATLSAFKNSYGIIGPTCCINVPVIRANGDGDNLSQAIYPASPIPLDLDKREPPGILISLENGQCIVSDAGYVNTLPVRADHYRNHIRQTVYAIPPIAQHGDKT
jgi:hypothetical protein